jgi:hypothetical protein
MSSEPGAFGTDMLIGLVGLIGVVSVPTIFLFGFPRRQKKLVALPLACMALLGVVAVYADDLHWKWSRDDFQAIVDGDEFSCQTDDYCRLGWWDAYEPVGRFDSMVVIWVRDDEVCYAGLAFARPVGEDPGGDVVREGAIANSLRTAAYLTVYPQGDGWYRLCYTT